MVEAALAAGSDGWQQQAQPSHSPAG